MTPPAPMGALSVDEIARLIQDAVAGLASWDDLSDFSKDMWRAGAQAAITALTRPQPAAGADLATAERERLAKWANAMAEAADAKLAAMIAADGICPFISDDDTAARQMDQSCVRGDAENLRALAALARSALPPPASDARAVTDAQRREIAEAWDQSPNWRIGLQRLGETLRAAGLLEDPPHAR